MTSGFYHKIRWGDGLTVKVEGKGVIRVDAGGGGGAISWDDVGGPGVGGGLSYFALTGSNWSFHTDDTPLILDATSLGAALTFSTNDAATFDMSSGGRARFLAPGMYVVGCQMHSKAGENLTAEVDTVLMLQYGGSAGYSIEVPYAISSFLGGSERLLGSRFDFPATTTISEDADVYLQRLHPISLTAASTFPLEIQPTFRTNTTHNTAWTSRWLGLWGVRLGAPLSAAVSD